MEKTSCLVVHVVPKQEQKHVYYFFLLKYMYQLHITHFRNFDTLSHKAKVMRKSINFPGM